MTDIEKILTERDKVQKMLDKAIMEREAIEHRLQRVENRGDFLKKGDRAKRTHRLCVKGAVVESLVPGLTDFSEKEFYELMEQVFFLPQVRSLVEGKINHRKTWKESNG